MRKQHLSLGDLANLLLAWEAGEVSEGRVVEVTGFDRVTCRDLKLSAIEAGRKLAEVTPEEHAALLATFGRSSTTSSTTDPPRSLSGTSEPEEPNG